MRARTLAFPAAALGVALAATPARAGDPDPYATVGVLVSVPLNGPIEGLGIGVEGSYHVQPDRHGYAGFGGFGQLQFMLSGGWRLAAGMQGNFAFAGAELGLALTAPHFTDLSLGLHVAPYLSIGYGGAAFRWTRRLAGDSTRVNDLALALTAKAWWYLPDYGDARLYDPPCGVYTQCMAIPGRPLVVDGAPVTAALAGDAPADRAAAWWARAALDEHAAVAAFARASLALMALGAPMELVARTHAAALDEVDHARRCAAVASRLAGRPLAPGPLPEAVAPMADASLVAFAVATLREGCVNEGAAANVARRGERFAADPEARATLAILAADEARHAALAWDTVAWCCEAGGAPVREALAAALDALEAPARVGAVEDPSLRALGASDGALDAACAAHALRAARRRYGRPRPALALAA